MLVVTCASTGKQVLLGLSAIQTVVNTPSGPVAVYLCPCGDVGYWPPDRAPNEGQLNGQASAAGM